MNNPNPFVPKGSILEQQSKRRSRLKLAVFCVLTVGVAGLSAMLIQGCKREQPADTGETPTIDTNTPAITDTNTPTIDTNAPPAMTNLPVAVAPPVNETAGTEYKVVKGDSFSKIAKKFGVTVKAISAANPGVDSTKLKIDQKLVIPAGGTSSTTSVTDTGTSAAGETVYTVKSGDTLTKIAHTHGTTVKAIEAANNLSTTKIKVGDKLKIPAKSEAAAPAAPAPAPEPAPVTTAPVAPVTPPSTTPAK